MRTLRAAPLALPAVAFWCGLTASTGLRLSTPLVGLLGLAGLALGRAGRSPVGRLAGWGCLWLALGCLRGLLAPDIAPSVTPFPGFDARRPVTATVVVAADWRVRDDRAVARVRVERLRQGPKVAPARFEAWLSLPKAPPADARRLRLKGYLDRSPTREDGAAGAWRLRSPSGRLVTVEERTGALGRWSLGGRRRVEKALVPGAPHGDPSRRDAGAALARALLLGRSDHLPDALHRALGRAGVAHVLALSGLHVGFLILGAFAIFGWLPRTPRLVFSGGAGLVYLLLAGPRPALTRATVMALLLGASLLSRRNPSPLNALAVAALGILAVDPASVASLGFRLTVAATAGLLALAPPLEERLRGTALGRRLPPWLSLSLAAGVAAQLATQPWIGPPLAGWSPLAPLWNLAAVPWAAGALTLSWLWLAVELLPLPSAASEGCLGLLGLWLRPVAWFVALPAGPWWFVPVAWTGMVWAAVCAATTGLLLRGGRRALAVAVLGLLLWGGWVHLENVGRPAELVALDVGQGDAVLLRRGSRAVLVDGGGLRGGFHRAGRVLVPELARRGVRRLDAVVLTHPDADHCGGLPGLTAWLPVAEIWTGPGWRGQPCADELFATPGARVRELTMGDRIVLGEGLGQAMTFEVLHPRPAEPLARSVNDRSLVLRATLGTGSDGFSALLTGDVGRLVEERLVARHGARLRADVLKVSHHGSRGSSASRFLTAVSPRVAVVSAGAGNRHGHPHPDTLERIREAGSGTLSTHRLGSVRLTTDTVAFYSYFAMRRVH